MPVQRASASEQIANELRAQIESGEFAPGQVFPSDAELAGRFDVSKPTITKARAMLVALGLVASRAGAASTVRDARDRVAAVGGVLPARWTGRNYPEGHYARIVRAAITPAPPDVAAAIGTEPGAPVIERREVIYAADDTPLAAARTCFPAILIDQCPALLEAEPVAGGATLYVERQTGRAAASVAADVSCRAGGSGPDGDAAQLQLALGTSVLALSTTTYDANDVAIAHEVELHPPGTPIPIDVGGSR
jgi:DNA-binding GntR family transcriptional regulator